MYYRQHPYARIGQLQPPTAPSGEAILPRGTMLGPLLRTPLAPIQQTPWGPTTSVPLTPEGPTVPPPLHPAYYRLIASIPDKTAAFVLGKMLHAGTSAMWQLAQNQPNLDPTFWARWYRYMSTFARAVSAGTYGPPPAGDPYIE